MTATAPVLEKASTKPGNHSRKRTILLVTVYLLIGLHIAHWKIAGRTLAPLELNEVMYTLELGIVTAGFLFMLAAAIGTLIFGRFFCSWACHILALQDLCAWILEKVRIRPKPVRSRLLLLVPPVALFYMFVWPQIDRIIQGREAPHLQLLADKQGWASFVTTDFWRNLPSPTVALLTFAVCGFATVYVLGSRAFCQYACPYGALFGLADRFAPGRIAAVGDCSGCGKCTAVCQSQVRVHEELLKHGQVVNPGCLKDLDCVDVCPDGAVAFAFRKPPGLASFGSKSTIRVAYDFNWAEELMMVAVFVTVLLVYRGLYQFVPFLMTLGLGGIAAYSSVLLVRLVRKPDVRLAPFQLARAGRITRAGWCFAALGVVAIALTVHSGWIRWEETQGAELLARAQAEPLEGPHDAALLAGAGGHLERRRAWGLVETPQLLHQLALVHELKGELPQADALLARVETGLAQDPMPHIERAWVQARMGQMADAEASLASALALPPPPARELAAWNASCASAHHALAQLLADRGRLEAAREHLNAAVTLQPASPQVRYDLGVVLSSLRLFDEARAQYEEAIRLDPRDPDLWNNLGFVLLESGHPRESEEKLRHALEIAPAHAGAHYNLGRLLRARGEVSEAQRHFDLAGAADARFFGAGAGK